MPKTTLIKTQEETDEQASSAVLAYRVGQLEHRTEQGFADIKEQNVVQIKLINNLTHEFVTRHDVEIATREASGVHIGLSKRIMQLENWNRWIARIIFTIIISAVLAVVIYPTISGHHL
jgi:hypothetical protein